MSKNADKKAEALKERELDKVRGGLTKDLLGDDYGDPRTGYGIGGGDPKYGGTSKTGGTNI